MLTEEHIERRGIRDPNVIRAVRTVPRHEFVPTDLQQEAYDDRPLGIGYGATISQPFIVAAMTELLQPDPRDIVLEIGTGSGYQAAVLSELVRAVYSVEIVPQLADSAAETLCRLGYRNVFVRNGDGYLGWPEHAPYDKVILTAAPQHIPQTLLDQLRPGGLLIAPVGMPDNQELLVVEKTGFGEYSRRVIFPVSFVPMVPASSN